MSTDYEKLMKMVPKALAENDQSDAFLLETMMRSEAHLLHLGHLGVLALDADTLRAMDDISLEMVGALAHRSIKQLLAIVIERKAEAAKS